MKRLTVIILFLSTLFVPLVAWGAENANIKVSIKTDFPGNVVFILQEPYWFLGAPIEHDRVKVMVRVDNMGGAKKNLDLRLSGGDWYNPELLTTTDTAITIPAYGQWERVLLLAGNRPNYYRIRAEVLQEAKVIANDYNGVVVTEKPANFGVDDPDSFFGIACPSGDARIERLGAKWVRIYWPFLTHWAIQEPSKGNFKFVDISRYRDNHILITYNPHIHIPVGRRKRQVEDTRKWRLSARYSVVSQWMNMMRKF